MNRLRIANAPCSWGVIEGINGDRGAYARVIDEMQATGYVGTELGEYLGRLRAGKHPG